MSYSEIIPNLYMGSAPPADLPARFDLVVLAAQGYQPKGFSGTSLIRAPLVDDFDHPLSEADGQMVRRVARTCANYLEHGHKVLVTCEMGYNRSGLIVALTLIWLGWTPPRAIERIRAMRAPAALSNPQFVQFILQS